MRGAAVGGVESLKITQVASALHARDYSTGGSAGQHSPDHANHSSTLARLNLAFSLVTSQPGQGRAGQD